MNLKKVAGWAAVIFIAWYIFTDPNAAAGTWHTIADTFTSAANSAATFLHGIG